YVRNGVASNRYPASSDQTARGRDVDRPTAEVDTVRIDGERHIDPIAHPKGRPERPRRLAQLLPELEHRPPFQLGIAQHYREPAAQGARQGADCPRPLEELELGH